MKNRVTLKKVMWYLLPVAVAVVAFAVLLWLCKDEKTPVEPAGTMDSSAATLEPTESGQTLPATKPGTETLNPDNEPLEPTAILPTVPDVPMNNPDTTDEKSGTKPALYNPEGTPALPTGKPDMLEFDIPGFSALPDAPLGDMGNNLRLAAVGRYTGEFMEDGSDDPVENVLALVVENTGEDLVEYAELSTDFNGSIATFKITSLPANGYVLVLESGRQTVADDTEIQLPQVSHWAKVNDLVLDYSNDFQIYTADGVINIVNISGKDFHNDICVYYKTYQYNVYMGGVAYRARFSGGLADGAVGQSMQSHFSSSNSVIFYMAYDE